MRLHLYKSKVHFFVSWMNSLMVEISSHCRLVFLVVSISVKSSKRVLAFYCPFQASSGSQYSGIRPFGTGSHKQYETTSPILLPLHRSLSAQWSSVFHQVRLIAFVLCGMRLHSFHIFYASKECLYLMKTKLLSLNTLWGSFVFLFLLLQKFLEPKRHFTLKRYSDVCGCFLGPSYSQLSRLNFLMIEYLKKFLHMSCQWSQSSTFTHKSVWFFMDEPHLNICKWPGSFEYKYSVLNYAWYAHLAVLTLSHKLYCVFAGC